MCLDRPEAVNKIYLLTCKAEVVTNIQQKYFPSGQRNTTCMRKLGQYHARWCWSRSSTRRDFNCQGHFQYQTTDIMQMYNDKIYIIWYCGICRRTTRCSSSNVIQKIPAKKIHRQIHYPHCHCLCHYSNRFYYLSHTLDCVWYFCYRGGFDSSVLYKLLLLYSVYHTDFSQIVVTCWLLQCMGLQFVPCCDVTNVTLLLQCDVMQRGEWSHFTGEWGVLFVLFCYGYVSIDFTRVFKISSLAPDH